MKKTIIISIFFLLSFSTSSFSKIYDLNDESKCDNLRHPSVIESCKRRIKERNNYKPVWKYQEYTDEYSDKKYFEAYINSMHPGPWYRVKIICNSEDGWFLSVGDSKYLYYNGKDYSTYVNWIIDKDKKSNDSWQIDKSLRRANLSKEKAENLAKKLSNANEIIKFHLNSPKNNNAIIVELDGNKIIKKVFDKCKY